MAPGAPKYPRKGAGFSWCRINDAHGTTYRLYWREPAGRLYVTMRIFTAAHARKERAQELCRLRHNLRVMRSNYAGI